MATKLEIVKIHYEHSRTRSISDEIAELSDGRFYVYTWDANAGQCTRGNQFARGLSAGAIQYVGDPFATLAAAKKAIGA
jgi:hypothetical protein